MSSGGGSQSVFKGYKYNMDMHMIVCHGPIDSLKKIVVQDKEITGDINISANQTLTIDQEEVFGGMDREGGLKGEIDLMFGTPSQAINEYLAAWRGELVPAYRGLFSLVLKDFYIGNSSYLKPWSFVMKRTTKGWDGGTIWYSAKAQIGEDMNPAHIIYECLVSESWGMAYPSDMIDEVSFKAVADALYTEGFGLSFLWYSGSNSIDEFISDVCRHIGGSLYMDVRTGLFTLRLFRDDYAVEDLAVLNEDNLRAVDSFARQLAGDAVNQVSVSYIDPDSGEQAMVTVHDQASISLQGAINPTVLQFWGIRNRSLANKVASRELRTYSSNLFSAVLIGNRSLAEFTHGDVALFSWPELGIDQVAVRIMSVDVGSLDKNEVKLSVTEDVYGALYEIYSNPNPTKWTDPISAPVDVEEAVATPLPYHFVKQEWVDFYIDPEEELLMTCVRRPTTDALDYRHFAGADEVSLVTQGSGTFSPFAATDGSVGMFDTNIPIKNKTAVSDVRVGSMALIGEHEIVQVTAVNAESVDVIRAVLDTVPWPYADGTNIFFFEDFLSYGSTRWISGADVFSKFLVRTGRGELKPSDATLFEGRAFRRQNMPYPPANVHLTDIHAFANYTDPEPPAEPELISHTYVFTFSWSRRNRIAQTDPVGYFDADVGLEPNTEFRDEYGDTTSGASSQCSITIPKDSPKVPFTAVVYAVREIRPSYEYSPYAMKFILEDYGGGWSARVKTYPLVVDIDGTILETGPETNHGSVSSIDGGGWYGV